MIGKIRFDLARYIVQPLIAGLLAYFLVGAYGMFNPTHVGWLQHADLAQSYYGWDFYRHDPMTMPFGANPSYGMEFHSSVYYSDSIPIVAMLLKPFSMWLPESFQYFGLWVLLCFFLQALFAQLLLSLVLDGAFARVIASVLFVLAPPLLLRLGGHMALVGQWAILAALYLYLRPEETRQRTWWTLLVPLSIVIHAYIFFMVVAIWLADIARRRFTAAGNLDRAMKRAIAGEVVQVALVTLAMAWTAGFFMVSSSGWRAEGFGIYKMNLLAVINGAGWSSFGLQFPMTSGESEGFNYLGVGGIALCVVAFFAWLKNRQPVFDQRVLWPILVVCGGFTLLAITYNVGVGGFGWHLALPAKIEQKLSHLSIQSTGRLFWVPYYLILIASVLTLARNLPRRIFLVVLVAGVALQMADLRLGIDNLRHLLAARSTVANAQGLQGAFWDAAGTKYSRLRLIPSRVSAPGWEVLAGYAMAHRMQTDAVQVARVDWKKYVGTREHQLALVTSGKADAGTLYIIDANEVPAVSRSLRAGDAFFSLDGWNVLAPDWGAALPAGAENLKH